MRLRVALFASVLVLGGAVRSEEKPALPAGHHEMTAEQRSKMADVHEKMAACLRSDRPLSECREGMMKGCHEVMGPDGCPMMGGMKHHGGMMPENHTHP